MIKIDSRIINLSHVKQQFASQINLIKKLGPTQSHLNLDPLTLTNVCKVSSVSTCLQLQQLSTVKEVHV